MIVLVYTYEVISTILKRKPFKGNLLTCQLMRDEYTVHAQELKKSKFKRGKSLLELFFFTNCFQNAPNGLKESLN